MLSVSIVTIGGYYRYNLEPVNNNKVKNLVIKEKSNMNDIINILAKDKLIRNEKVFKIYLQINQVKAFKEGTYKITGTMSSYQIARKLSVN